MLAPTHFALFQLEPRFTLAQDALETAYRALVARVHPDRFAAADANSQKMALESATAANEAYRTLKKPLLRARYLLALRGIEVGQGHSPSPAILMQQVDWREALEDALRMPGKTSSKLARLDQLSRDARLRVAEIQDDMAKFFDAPPECGPRPQDSSCPGHAIDAVESVEEWLFIEKLIADIDQACSALEDL